jgi:hypothetical protein
VYLVRRSLVGVHMAKLTLTIDEAELLRSQHAAAQRGDILFDEIIMPNGRPLGECTSDYMGQVGEALVELSRMMGSHQRDPKATAH